MPSVTLATLQQQVYDRLDNNQSFYPPTQVTQALNQILKRLNILTGFIQATVAIPGFSQAGAYLYATPAGIIVPLRIEFESSILQKASLSGIARKYRDWTNDTTASLGPVARWAPIGISQFVIHPADATGGRFMQVTGIAPVPMLVNSGNIVKIPDEFVSILIEYAVQRVVIKDGMANYSGMQTIMAAMMDKIRDFVIWEDTQFLEQFFLRKDRAA